MKGQTPQPNAAEEAKWYWQFEALGRDTVRLAIARGQGFVPERKRELAILWLREKELEAEKLQRDAGWYAKWTWYAALSAAVLAAIGILVAVLHL